MRIHLTTRITGLLLLLLSLVACTKKDIEFGTALGETYTNVAQTDTFFVALSTLVSDSFATNGISDMIAGSYADSLLGTTRAKAFVQLLPATLAETLEDNAVYDSLCFVVRLNHYSYGDTTQPQTVSITELAEPLSYTYGSSIYNTSSFAEAPTPLGSKTVRIRPALTDSVVIRLNDDKGRELFSKLQQGASELQTSDAFLNYFRGVSIRFSSPSPSAVYGFARTDSTLVMRLHYHTSIPYPVARWKNFPYYSNLSSNQILTDRSGTPLATLAGGGSTSSAVTGGKAFTQFGTGTVLKIGFPTLRNVLQLASTVKVLKATLVLKVPPQSYSGTAPLPSALMVYQTDETNVYGSPLYNAAGDAYLSAAPQYDSYYDGTTSYTLDLTSYVNSLVSASTAGSAGLFLVEGLPGSSGRITRAVFNDGSATKASSQLVLSLLTVKN